MRSAALAALWALLVVLTAVPLHLGGASGVAVPPAASRASVAPAASLPSPVSGGVALYNTTLSPALAASLPSASSAPTSALPITPPIVPPSTSPTVVYFLNSSKTCCVSANFTAPVGTWALVELRYNGQAVSAVFDSSFRAYIDQVQVLFGTSPEYGQWNVTQDVTPYVSLLRGTYNFTFLLSAAIPTGGGYFLTSVSLWFYPLPAGVAPPVEPNTIVPLFHRVFVSTSSLSVSTIATVPSNATNATLELWTYALDADEFWYSLEPTYREMHVASDGQGIAAVAPFPFINTGGTDPFAWRPITGAFTISNRPYDLDVSGALGIIEGTHNFTANLTGVGAGANWLIGGALLLYTSSSAGPATSTSYQFSDPPVRSTIDTTHYDQSESTTYSYSSTWSTPTAQVVATTFGNTTFSSAILNVNGWENLSLVEGTSTHSILQQGENVTSPSTSYAFNGSMDLGGTFVETSNTGGGYPIYGNFTTDFLNVRQEWNESRSLYVLGAGAAPVRLSQRVDNVVLGGNNLLSGKEERISPTAAVILSYTLIQSAMLDDLRESSSGGPLPYEYDHLVSGSAYQPPGPDNAETVYVNAIDSPVHAAVEAAPAIVDVGEPIVITAIADGGIAPYEYDYLGLPPGCASANVTTLSCLATTPGAYEVELTATDMSHSPSAVASARVVVAPAPTIFVSTNRSVGEVGSPVAATATVVGGTGPFTCTWSINYGPTTTASCAQPFDFVLPAVGPTGVYVTVADATGFDQNGSYVISVVAGPSVYIWPAPEGNLTAGERWTVVATVTGGIGPYFLTWWLDGEAIQTGWNETWSGTAFLTLGANSMYVSLVDAEGVYNNSPPITFNVSVAPGPGTGGSGNGGAGSSSDIYLGLGLGAVLGATVSGAVVWLASRRQRKA